MCGIVGRYNFLSGAPVKGILLRGMCDFLAHRGPDGEGIFIDGSLGLGHRRLAVIDLTPAAHQPMVSRDGRVAIVYNGEIYNFRELRKSLEACGHEFRSQSDTEVILACYREYGVKCLDYLKGMFAFAIWDSNEQSLFLARDRVGKKPLFYWIDHDGIAFASEPKAFLADPGFKAEANLEAISHYLTLQYVPSPFSAFKGIRKIQPAHYMIVKDGRLQIERYWRLSYRNTCSGSEEELSQELLVKLKKAVDSRLISDVPLGAFLSGGIDSSVIVAIMAKLGVGPLKTFSIGFEQSEYNELPYARLIANRYGTDHQEFVVSPKASEIFPKLIWHYNEPFGDSSAIPSFYLSQMTRQHVTVALNGDGGDENLAGYDRYLASKLGRYYDSLPDICQRILQLTGDCLPERGKAKSILGKAKRFLALLGERPESRYAHLMSHFFASLKSQVCTDEFLLETNLADSEKFIFEAFEGSDAPDLVDATLDVDVNTYLPEDLLVKVDIATMAYGLEARSPFLDHEFMEFCASLPSHMKLRGRTKKFILKLALSELLPKEIINRPKMGFGVPIDHWFRHELKEMAYDILLSSRTIQRGYFHEKVIKQLLDEHVSGVRNWHYQLWNLLVLELWHRMFIDGEWAAEVRDLA